MPLLDTRDILLALLSGYSLGDISSINLISKSRNFLFRVSTSDGSYIARISKVENKDNILNIFSLQEYLFIKCAPVAQPVRRLDGEAATYFNDALDLYCILVEEYVPGKVPEVNVNNFFVAGAYLAFLHEACNDYPHSDKIIRSDLNTLLSQPVTYIVEQVARDIARQVESLSQNLRQILDGFIDQVLLGICHGDSHHYNLHLNDNKVVFLDLEDVQLSWYAYDIATMIWGTFGRGGNAEIWNAIFQGYSSVRPLSKEETQVIKYFVAVRQIWWLGLHARHWKDWSTHKNKDGFFQGGVELLFYIYREGCGMVV